ncbi:hypothetical protein K466DRAFT_481834 [Polyporus arcularius HHB13444]|uniref:Protein kinase domain-containing protein n=1 Tax=Polyporus arcularius HHB13444 TaxID=1314778 RepID=A0A5C3PVH2_9APHY|nr:hypothetical protein K466DRAFT_481834 [Polyporus arcularius HHB13444]
MIPPPQPPQEASDIFSISDQVLADRLQFIEEIGFGNWGSVWLCQPKGESSANPLQDSKIAVKLVHRSKTSTTAARVRSLWNEMKVVRKLKHEPHPSIIPFYSFIITPSYALITMAYHPRLITVEVSESHAKEWFRSLLSGVEFLHKRGVVHNDIKPANILLSNENVPVLVDFGFAERYDMDSSEAFHSNLSYGTPEYLSPERARGLPHDTRKSDVWSLGVTFFEILIGRTPFEHSEGEQFSTKDDLERYWQRTLRGKWVGQWKMSKGVEKLLRRMILPNADLRCTACDAMADPYWTQTEAQPQAHKKSASIAHSRTSSLIDTKVLDVISPWSSRVQKEKEKVRSDRERIKTVAGGKENATTSRRDAQAAATRPGHGHSRSQSQPKLHFAPDVPTRGVTQAKRQHGMPSVFSALSPIKHSPPAAAATTTFAAAAKEKEAGKASRATRKPLGPRSPASSSSLASPPGTLRGYASKENTHNARTDSGTGTGKENKRRSVVLRDVTSTRQHDENVASKRAEKEKASSISTADTSKDSVRSRMKEWERERERLREMSRLEERVREVEEEREREHESERLEEELRVRERERLDRERQREAERERERERVRREGCEREYVLPKISVGPSLTPPISALPSPLSPLFEEPSEPPASPQANESGISVLKQSFRMSIGNAVRLYKSSTQLLGRSTPALTLGSGDADDDSNCLSEQQSWENEVQHEEETRMDRMTIWIQNVEKVVDEARQNFAASTSSAAAPSALPIAPISRRSSHSRSGRANRVPRKILAANEIFLNDCEPGSFCHSTAFSMDRSAASMSPLPSPSILNTMNFGEHTLPTIPSEQPSRVYAEHSRSYVESPVQGGSAGPSAVMAMPETPSRMRRATVVTRSPESGRKALSLEIDLSPSKRREKSRSYGDLLRPITPINKLEFELERLSQPTPPPRLSAMVDKNLFIAPANRVHVEETIQESTPQRQKDDLTASPLHVEPYPQRPMKEGVALDTPAKRHLEGVYDRFLMSTSGVRRNGKGYQSENVLRPVENIRPHTSMAKRNQKFFTTRAKMPPPVSSDDLRRSSSVDEFGTFLSTPAPMQEQNHNTIAIVRKAFKAIVTGKPNARTTPKPKPAWH